MKRQLIFYDMIEINKRYDKLKKIDIKHALLEIFFRKSIDFFLSANFSKINNLMLVSLIIRINSIFSLFFKELLSEELNYAPL